MKSTTFATGDPGRGGPCSWRAHCQGRHPRGHCDLSLRFLVALCEVGVEAAKMVDSSDSL